MLPAGRCLAPRACERNQYTVLWCMRVPCCTPRFYRIDEAIDHVTYVLSLKRQIEEKGIELGEGIDTN